MELRKTTINGQEYCILMPPVRASMDLSTRVTVLAGPVIASIGGAIKEGGWGKFAQAIQSVDPTKMNELLLDTIRISKLSVINASGNSEIFDIIAFEQYFNGRRGDLYQVMVWCLWECIRDFFPPLGTFFQKMKVDLEKGLNSQKDGQSTIG